jgi:hypothetical protein
MSYSHSSDRETEGSECCSLLSPQPASVRAVIHTQSTWLQHPYNRAMPCASHPFQCKDFMILCLTVGNRITPWVLMQFQNQTQHPYCKLPDPLLYGPTWNFQAPLSTWEMPGSTLGSPQDLGNTCELTQCTLGPNEVTKRWYDNCCALAHLHVHFPGPQAFTSSLLNCWICCLMSHLPARSSSVFITLPTN